MGNDRFLTGILVGIGVLVTAALILFFFRQGQVDYSDDSTPAGALRNYFLAIQKRDYERAYSYLAEQTEKPGLAQFREPFLTYLQDGVSGSTVEVGRVFLDEQSQEATVEVTILNSTQDIFRTATRQTGTAILVHQNGAWKVLSAPYPYGYPDLPRYFPTPPLLSPTPPISPTSASS